MVTTIHGFSSRADPARLPRVRRRRPLRVDQRRRPAPRPHLRRDDPPRHRASTASRSARATAATCSSSGGSIRTRARTRRSRSRAWRDCRSSSPASCTTRTTTAGSSSRSSTARRCRYVGPVGPAERDRLLGGAVALLHLIGFDEPFGLSVVESMATGTPVIAYPRGSMPELIDVGVTGFLVTDPVAAAAAVRSAYDLDRTACRDRRDAPVLRRPHGRRLPRPVRRHRGAGASLTSSGSISPATRRGTPRACGRP